MYDRIYNIYESIIQRTSSDLLLFFIVVAIPIVALYIMVLKDRRIARKHEADEELKKEAIAVIKENSAVIASLKSVLENQGTETRKSVERINERIDDVLANTQKIQWTLAERGCIRGEKDIK